MRSMGEVRVRATETVRVSKHPPHPASPPKGGEEHEGMTPFAWHAVPGTRSQAVTSVE
jgi:hypothetical protein